MAHPPWLTASILAVLFGIFESGFASSPIVAAPNAPNSGGGAASPTVAPPPFMAIVLGAPNATDWKWGPVYQFRQNVTITAITFASFIHNEHHAGAAATCPAIRLTEAPETASSKPNSIVLRADHGLSIALPITVPAHATIQSYACDLTNESMGVAADMLVQGTVAISPTLPLLKIIKGGAAYTPKPHTHVTVTAMLFAPDVQPGRLACTALRITDTAHQSTVVRADHGFNFPVSATSPLDLFDVTIQSIACDEADPGLGGAGDILLSGTVEPNVPETNAILATASPAVAPQR